MANSNHLDPVLPPEPPPPERPPQPLGRRPIDQAPVGPRNQGSAENRTPPLGSSTPGQTRIPDSSSHRSPTTAPSPITASRTTASTPTTAPTPMTDRVTRAPGAILAPSNTTEQSTVAPAPTAASRPMVLPPHSFAAGSMLAPG